MKRFLACLSLLLAVLTARAAAGDWTHHLAYHNATAVTTADGAVYALLNGNLLSYDPATEEVHLFSKNDGLTGRNITHMVYSSTAHCLVLVYADLGIDLLGTDGEITALPQIKNADDGTTTVNAVSMNGADAVLALSNGVVHIDAAREEIRGYYNLGRNVNAAAVVGNRLYAATSEGLMSGDLTDNLADLTRWQTTPGLQATLLTPFADGLYYVVTTGADTGLWRLPADADAATAATRLDSRVFTSAAVSGSLALFKDASTAVAFSATTPQQAALQFEAPAGSNALTRATDGTFWSADGNDGLRAYRLAAEGTSLTATGTAVGNYGPRRDLCYVLSFAGRRLLIAGGRLDPMDQLHYEATIMVYENGTWSAFQEDGISEQTGVPYRDITRVAQDPADPAHLFASAAGTGLYEFRDGRFVRQYTVGNSPLRSAAATGHPYYVRIDGTTYDAEGNLWLVNNGTDTLLRVLRADGGWGRIYVDALRTAPTVEKILFDSNGRLWVTSRRSASDINYEAGLLCLDYNGTIDNTADDVASFRSSVYNQDGTSCDLSVGVYDIIQDTDGALWVGTAGGLYVIDDPDEWTAANFRITQIKVPRNDGTNLADYLLAGVRVNAIAIDGAGRKWIGTLGNGLYLVSPDGTSIIHHFEADSSPLLSDNIYDVEIDAESGEVYIATDEGLCSYAGDATTPAESLAESNVKVFPNPVRPDYSGNITVTGLTADADVKVTTTGGQVVAAGTSAGGTFIWNGRTASGRRAATGVYYIMVATADGNSGIVAKVVVI